MGRTDSLEKTLMLGKIAGGRIWGLQSVRWLASLTDGHEFELASGAKDGPGSLACSSPRGRKESNVTE